VQIGRGILIWGEEPKKIKSDKTAKTDADVELRHVTTMKKKRKNRKGIICYGCHKPRHMRADFPEENRRLVPTILQE